jgi:hypothetical protein
MRGLTNRSLSPVKPLKIDGYSCASSSLFKVANKPYKFDRVADTEWARSAKRWSSASGTNAAFWNRHLGLWSHTSRNISGFTVLITAERVRLEERKGAS